MDNLAISYIRFSSPAQAKGRSFQRQLQACKEYCDRKGLHLADGSDMSFFDAGKSAFKGEHVGEDGALARFLALVKQKKIAPGTTLVVESLDRLSRQDVLPALNLFLGLITAGIRIVTLMDGERVYEGKDIDFADVGYSLSVMSSAYGESLKKSKRSRANAAAAQEDARASKTPLGRVMPLWLECVGERGAREFRVIEDRAEIVRRIFRMAIDGHGQGLTARKLNDEGLRTFKAGTPWGSTSIRKILFNRAVLGDYQPFSVQGSPDGKRRASGEPIKGYFPRIVDDDTFNMAQKATDDRLVRLVTKPAANCNVWNGIAKCILCGEPMHLISKGNPPRGFKYLQCYGKRKGVCENKLIRSEPTEQVFKAMLARLESLSLVKDASAKIAADLDAVQGDLVQQVRLLQQYQVQFESVVVKKEGEIEVLREEERRLQGELAAERGIGFQTFMDRLELRSYTGRYKANQLLHRLDVRVHIGVDGYAVSQAGRIIFGMAHIGGVPGYLGSLWQPVVTDESLHVAASRALSRMLKLQTFIPATEVGLDSYRAEVDAEHVSEAMQEAEREGMTLTEAEIRASWKE
jgi:DNA invertase Pin-like site-specific DNA recombinase